MSHKLFRPGRGRIIAFLRQGPLTAERLALELGVTTSAVRAQIAAMERDGVVRCVGKKRGTTRPSRVFELKPEIEHLFSRAYVPVLTHLIDIVTAGRPAAQLQALLDEVGKRLADELSPERPAGRLASRVAAASDLLNERLGARTRVEKNGHYVIRGEGCPLSAVTGKHPAVCRAMERLVQELVDAPVQERCDRGEPRCRFEVDPTADVV